MKTFVCERPKGSQANPPASHKQNSSHCNLGIYYSGGQHHLNQRKIVHTTQTNSKQKATSQGTVFRPAVVQARLLHPVRYLHTHCVMAGKLADLSGKVEPIASATKQRLLSLPSNPPFPSEYRPTRPRGP